jgi:HEPN domain-containing protein
MSGLPPDQLSWLQQWIQKAENDLRNAEHTIKMNPEVCPYDTVCFHAQHHLGVSVQDQDQLTEYATVSRYPEEVNTLTSKDAGWAMAIAHQIRDAVRVRLPKNALQQI